MEHRQLRKDYTAQSGQARQALGTAWRTPTGYAEERRLYHAYVDAMERGGHSRHGWYQLG